MSYNTQNYQNQHQQNGKGVATSRMAATNLGISETSLNIPIELQVSINIYSLLQLITSHHYEFLI
jgi:hypothetical protein